MENKEITLVAIPNQIADPQQVARPARTQSDRPTGVSVEQSSIQTQVIRV